MTKRQKFFSALGRFFKNFFTKNIVLKIVVVLFAILLWGFVIAEENPEYTKRIYGVEIDLRNEDSLLAKGWMLIDRSASTADVDVKCEIKKHGSLDSSQVESYIDLSKVAAASSMDVDTVTIPLEVKYEVAAEYGTFEGATVDRVDVTLAKTQTLNNQTVEVETTGSQPEGLYVTTPSNVTIASLTGQQSQVSRISKMKVIVDLNEFTGMEPGIYDVNLPVRFYQKGSTEAFDFITSNGESLTTGVRVTVRACKEVPIAVNIVGSDEFAEWYECRPRLTGSTTIKLCADKQEVLDEIEQVETEPIVPRMFATVEARSCTLVIPEGTTTVSGQSKIVVPVVLTVTEKMESKDVSVIINYSETKPGIYLNGEEKKRVMIRVTGTHSAMQSFNESWLSASISIQNYLQGTIRLPVQITFTGDKSLYDYELVDPADGVVKIVLITMPGAGAGPGN